MERALVAVNEIEDIFDRILVAIDEVFEFRDRDRLVKCLFKDCAEMMDMGIFQRDIIIQSLRADVVNSLYQSGFGLLVLVVHGVYHRIQIMLMIGHQKRWQQREGAMWRF